MGLNCRTSTTLYYHVIAHGHVVTTEEDAGKRRNVLDSPSLIVVEIRLERTHVVVYNRSQMDVAKYLDSVHVT